MKYIIILNLNKIKFRKKGNHSLSRHLFMNNKNCLIRSLTVVYANRKILMQSWMNFKNNFYKAELPVHIDYN